MRVSTLLVVGLVLAACASPPPELTAEVEAELIADALVRGCSGECEGGQLYVVEVLDEVTRTDPGIPMPPEVVAAIAQRLPDARFVAPEEVDALFGDDMLIDAGQGIVATLGPVRELAEGVVGVQVALSIARFDGSGRIFQFQWRAGEWVPATTEDTGVTVTSWVS